MVQLSSLRAAEPALVGGPCTWKAEPGLLQPGAQHRLGPFPSRHPEFTSSNSRHSLSVCSSRYRCKGLCLGALVSSLVPVRSVTENSKEREEEEALKTNMSFILQFLHIEGMWDTDGSGGPRPAGGFGDVWNVGSSWREEDRPPSLSCSRPQTPLQRPK